MRAALVVATSTGGIGTHVASLVRRLPALGVDVDVVCPAGTERQFRFADLGARYTAVEIASGPRPRLDAEAVRTLRRALGSVDVAHSHGLRATALSGLALGPRRTGRVPLVATWHNAVVAGGVRRGLLAGLELLAARRTDVTLGASADLVERARRLGAPDARLAPVAAPPLPPPRKDRATVRAELGALERPLVLAVGRLAPQKDYDTLLAAAATWQARVPRPLLVIAGDGSERSRLQRIIDGGPLDVRLLGHRDDVAELLAAADVYVLTSVWEARALVVQEALRAGAPVVATAVGGVPELVGDAAVLVPPRDAAAVAQAVLALLDDDGQRAEFVRRGRGRAASWPDEADTARHVAAVYREVTGA